MGTLPECQKPGALLPATGNVQPFVHLDLMRIDPHHDPIITPQPIPHCHPVQMTCRTQQRLALPRP